MIFQAKAAAENVTEGSELQLLKPRPAPKPEKAPVSEPEQATEDAASIARESEGVTSEKIQVGEHR